MLNWVFRTKTLKVISKHFLKSSSLLPGTSGILKWGNVMSQLEMLKFGCHYKLPSVIGQTNVLFFVKLLTSVTLSGNKYWLAV